MTPRVSLTDDVKPLSEFRAHASAMLAQVHKTRRPLVITQNGNSAAVLLDVAEYENLIQTIEVLQDIGVAEEQIAAGQVLDADAAKKKVLARIHKYRLNGPSWLSTESSRSPDTSRRTSRPQPSNG